MVHQDQPHQVCCHAEKVRAVLPVLLVLIDHAQVGFMRQRGGLQRMAYFLPAQITGGELSQLIVDEGSQMVEGQLTALAPVK